MTILRIKGRDIETISVKDSHSRRALQCRGKIIALMKTIGVNEDNLDISEERVANRKAPAFVKWYFDGKHMYYSYFAGANYAENLYVAFKVVETFINDLIEEKITLNDFLNEFAEDDDIIEKRKKARKALGLDEETMDVEAVDKAYKKLAKELHPDMPSGSAEKFKQINNAHKLLKKELT